MNNAGAYAAKRWDGIVVSNHEPHKADADKAKEPIMLQKQSISRNQVFYLIIAVGALALIIAFSLIHNAGYVQLSGFSAEPATAANLMRSDPRVLQAETNRLNAVAGEAVNLYGSTARVSAELSAPMVVESQRLIAAAGQSFNLHGSTAWVYAGFSTPAQAEAARLTGLAGDSVNIFGSTAWLRGGLSSAMRTEAARWNALAGEHYNRFGSSAWVHGSLNPGLKTEAERMQGLAGEYFNLFGTTAR